MEELKLNKETVARIEQILARGQNAELALRNGRIIVWSVSSKKQHEQPVAR